MVACRRLTARLLILGLAIVAMMGPAAAANEAALYRAFGERAGLVAIVDDATNRWIADARIAETFNNLNIPRFKARLVDQLCELTGGPCRYTGRNMHLSHRGLHLTTVQFNALVEGLQLAMDKQGIAFATQNRLLAILAPMKRDIVTR